MSFGQMHVVRGRGLGVVFRKEAAAVRAQTGQKVKHFGQLLKTRIQANASGRPGPNAPTGTYRRSWTMDFSQEGDTATADVGTNQPQGRRLEFGYHGTDSLGRTYNQPPYAHVGPAMDWLEPLLDRGFDEVGPR